MDNHELIVLLEDLTAHARREWRSVAKDNPSNEHVKAVRDGVLAPTIQRITIILGQAAAYQARDVFKKGTESLAQIYELSNTHFNASFPSTEHLSHTVPSKLVIEYSYILGGYLLHRGDNVSLDELLNTRLKITSQYSSVPSKEYLLTHPNFDSRSGEGDLTTFFEQARAIAKDDEVFFEWFDQDEETITSLLVQFDFLINLYYTIVKGVRYHHYPNFKRYYKHRTAPILRELLDEQDKYKSIAGPNVEKNIKDYLAVVGKIHDRFFDWFGGWGDDFPELKDVTDN